MYRVTRDLSLKRARSNQPKYLPEKEGIMPENLPTAAVIAYSVLTLVLAVGLGITWRKLRHKRTTRAQVFGFVAFLAAGATTLILLPDDPYPVFGASTGKAQVWITVSLVGFGAFGLVYWLLKPAAEGKRGLRLPQRWRKTKPLRTMSSKELAAKKAELLSDPQATRPLDDQADLGSRLASTTSAAPAAGPTAIRTLTEAEQMEYFQKQLEAGGLLDDTAKRAANQERYRTDLKYAAFVDKMIQEGHGDPRDDV